MTSGQKQHSIVFFGTGPVAAASLRGIANYFSIEAVITKATPSHHKVKAPVETLADELNIPLFYANTRTALDTLFDERAFSSTAGVIVDHGVIISQKVIDTFEYGIINSHFSLLPEWRGADPITFSLLSGQKKTGVSLMVIDTQLDTGKLITQKVLHIATDDTLISLTDRLVQLSNSLLREFLPRYLTGEIKPKNQPHPDRATYSHKLTKADGIIDWNKPATQLEREVRAYQGWPGSHATLGGIDLIITKSAVTTLDEPVPGKLFIEKKRLLVGTGEDWLDIQSVKPAGKKEMPIQAFLSGYRSQLES